MGSAEQIRPPSLPLPPVASFALLAGPIIPNRVGPRTSGGGEKGTGGGDGGRGNAWLPAWLPCLPAYVGIRYSLLYSVCVVQRGGRGR